MALATSGCSLLDMSPDGRVTLKEIFANHDKTGAYLNSCYADIPEKGNSYYWVCNAPTALSDEGYLTYGQLADGIPAKMYQGSASASSHPLRDYATNKSYYATYMWQLRQCTTFLQNIDGANVNTEQERDRWRAEAHVLRAYYMSEMLKWFGTFAYEPNGYPDTYDYTKLVPRSVWELAVLIDQECTAAINSTNLPWRIDQSDDYLRMTKAVAWCIKSKMYLFAASPLHSEDYSDAEVVAHWKTAFEVNQQALEALEAQGFALKTTATNTSLYTGPAAAYQELFTSTALTSADDPETIWQRSKRLNFIHHNYIGSLSWRNATRAGIVPTQELFDAYEVTDANRTQAVPLLNLANPYQADKTPNYNAEALALGFDEQNPYAANRDPRLAVTIVKNGDQVYWDGEYRTVETFVDGDNGITNSSTEQRFTRTGYYFRKYVAPNADAVNGIESPDWKYFRLAEIKLNLAEAAAEAGELAVAKQQVDDIRRRVGMPELPAGLSQAEMLLRVRQERMVELCYEECRYFDVRRWAVASVNSAGYKDFKLRCQSLTGMWITKSPDNQLIYTRKSDLKNGSTGTRDLLLPIPESEAQTLYSLTNRRWQNSGW